MFHIKANAMMAGDVAPRMATARVLGYTVPVMRVEPAPEDRFEVPVATGSCPDGIPNGGRGLRRSLPKKKDVLVARHELR